LGDLRLRLSIFLGIFATPRAVHQGDYPTKLTILVYARW